ncbi:response regulator [Opitutus sp. GAS368]|uniref:response regulator n=1 Tax=Opitutus sp. GAS368 TaxID=1882749 RepID=UPI000B843E0B|nr:response regulator [Opitutus sp. GAS368]
MAKKQKVKKAESALQTRLGATVRSYRQRLGITQEELAWRAGMHRTYLADIERGARNITLRSVANLAQALQVSVEGLLLHTNGAEGSPGQRDADGSLGEILLVEDNPDDVELTRRAFAHAKITNPVRVMRDGEEALQYLFGSGRYTNRAIVMPQLVLLDLGLPKIPGTEVLRQMKTSRAFRDIPVVILTDSRKDENIMECSRLGAAHYIIKPVEFESFARVTSQMDFHWILRRPEASVPSNPG